MHVVITGAAGALGRGHAEVVAEDGPLKPQPATQHLGQPAPGEDRGQAVHLVDPEAVREGANGCQ